LSHASPGSAVTWRTRQSSRGLDRTVASSPYAVALGAMAFLGAIVLTVVVISLVVTWIV